MISDQNLVGHRTGHDRERHVAEGGHWCRHRVQPIGAQIADQDGANGDFGSAIDDSSPMTWEWRPLPKAVMRFGLLWFDGPGGGASG